MHGKTWQVLTLSLLLAGWSAGTAGQGSVQLGSGGGAAAGIEASGTAAAGAGDGEDELLFVDGPRQPGVLSEAGSLIRTGVRAREASSSGQSDAVSALVASALGEEDASADASAAMAGETAESEEEPRKGVRNLFRSLGSFLGLGRDS